MRLLWVIVAMVGFYAASLPAQMKTTAPDWSGPPWVLPVQPVTGPSMKGGQCLCSGIAVKSPLAGVYSVGGGVSVPVLIYTPAIHDPCNAEDEGRREKNCVEVDFNVVISAEGNVREAKILRLASDSDVAKKAMQQLMQYRFKPAMKDGKPVPVRITVEISVYVAPTNPPKTGTTNHADTYVPYYPSDAKP